MPLSADLLKHLARTLSPELLEDIRSNNYREDKLNVSADSEDPEDEGMNEQECIELADALRHNSHVTELVLDGNYRIGDVGIQAISKLINIKKLHITNTGVTEKGIAYLNENTNFEELSLCGEISNEIVNLLSKNTSVTNLSLLDFRIGEQISAFKDNIVLKRLTLCNNRLFSKDIEKLCQSNTIENLVLPLNQLDDSCIPMLMNMPSLTSVDLRGNDRITPAAYAPLKEMLGKKRKEIESRDVKEERVEANPSSFRKLTY